MRCTNPFARVPVTYNRDQSLLCPCWKYVTPLFANNFSAFKPIMSEWYQYIRGLLAAQFQGFCHQLQNLNCTGWSDVASVKIAALPNLDAIRVILLWVQIISSHINSRQATFASKTTIIWNEIAFEVQEAESNLHQDGFKVANSLEWRSAAALWGGR